MKEPQLGPQHADADAERLYLNNAHIHAAVNAVVALMQPYSRDAIGVTIFRENMIRFFASFDRLRTDQLESQRKKIVDAVSMLSPVFMVDPGKL